MLYIESSKKVTVLLNGQAEVVIEPLEYGTKTRPGLFLITGNVFSAKVINGILDGASVFYASIERGF
jgi:hypothetical protein